VNPERDVIADIDALVDESLAHGPTDDYSRSYSERCGACGLEWHGEANPYGCPGAYGTLDPEAAVVEHTPPGRLQAMLDEMMETFDSIGLFLPEDFDAAAWLCPTGEFLRQNRCMQCQRYMPGADGNIWPGLCEECHDMAAQAGSEITAPLISE
jgi:hypothetical protein